MKKKCLICNKEYSKNPKESKTQWAGRKYCGYPCSYKANPTKFKKGNPAPKTAFKKGEHPSIHTEFKKGDIRIVGQNNFNWRNGITPEIRKLRTSKEYKLWRIAVFIRDDYTCQICNQRGVYLHADHLSSFARYPEVRYAINNGRTLCAECHRNTKTYGRGSWLMKEQNYD